MGSRARVARAGGPDRSGAARGGLVPGDAVRLASAISVVVAALGYGGVAGPLFLLVLGGTMVPRALGLPDALDVSYCGVLLVAAWAAQLDWYLAVDGLDLLVHALATGLIAVVAQLTLARAGMVASVDTPGLARPRLGVAVVTVALGVALATVWEVGEWAGHTLLDDRIQVGYADTMSDLLAGAAGALVAGVLLARRDASARWGR